MLDVKALLEPIADWFRNFGMPEPIVHWGHPLMMAIVVFVMGSFVGLAGWRGRMLATVDEAAAVKSRLEHRRLAPLMFLFMALGYTGGVLSLVMQQQSILKSPHFWTGSIVLILLGLNGLIAWTGFGVGNLTKRTVHAYLGSAALCLLFLHAVFGLKLGLAV
jgi:fucose 4-O-acetylase-like acetyltransferase